MTSLSSSNDHTMIRAQALALMHKFLSNSNMNSNRHESDSDSDSDPYSSDLFRMYEFKIRKCTRSRNHDWTDCPFAHSGEKARRRDPRRFRYSATICPEYRRLGSCCRGDECEFAHGVFECWLHPSRYRTEACKDGKFCKRKVCFFAHSPRQLRLLSGSDDGDETTEFCGSKVDLNNHSSKSCCRHCCAPSPTSTLIARPSHLSPPLSPPMSPPQSPMEAHSLPGYSPLSRSFGSVDTTYGFNPNSTKGLTYEDMMLADLMGSLDSLNIGSPSKRSNGLRVDIGYNNGGLLGDDQMQFCLSPSTPIKTPTAFSRAAFLNANAKKSADLVASNHARLFNNAASFEDRPNVGVTGNGSSGPDIGWVNDLIM